MKNNINQSQLKNHLPRSQEILTIYQELSRKV